MYGSEESWWDYSRPEGYGPFGHWCHYSTCRTLVGAEPHIPPAEPPAADGGDPRPGGAQWRIADGADQDHSGCALVPTEEETEMTTISARGEIEQQLCEKLLWRVAARRLLLGRLPGRLLRRLSQDVKAEEKRRENPQLT